MKTKTKKPPSLELLEEKIRNSIEMDRYWVVRDNNRKGFIALKVHVSYPFSREIAKRFRDTLDGIPIPTRKLDLPEGA
jgi:hypothetical protein